ncbi:MAG TPA: helix-turn-helix domain-containing protein [Gaiellaceae bacterium]|nr:helix-turn-helix domain-containing protein [Gaiellaceae bacterium]
MGATRLPAAERRRAILDAALRVFSEGSYAGSTTAEIARAAGVSEPILYRHFSCKRELYLACLDEVWRRRREAVERTLRELGPEAGWRAMGRETLREGKVFLPSLWIQAIAEAGEDAEIRRYLRRHMREVHDFFAGVLCRLQEAGTVHPDRDADAEAWIFLGGMLALAIADRLGGPVGRADVERIGAERRRWLAGSEARAGAAAEGGAGAHA